MLSDSTSPQLTAQIRQLITAVGTILGLVGFSHAAEGVNLALAIVGPAMVIASSFWSIYANLKTSIVKSARAIPEVRGVITADTKEGRALADAIPGPDVVPAGTASAKIIAS